MTTLTNQLLGTESARLEAKLNAITFSFSQAMARIEELETKVRRLERGQR
jgi:hypothetical protein